MDDEVYKEVCLEEPIKDDPEFDAIEKLMTQRSDVDESKCKGRD